MSWELNTYALTNSPGSVNPELAQVLKAELLPTCRPRRPQSPSATTPANRQHQPTVSAIDNITEFDGNL